MNNREAEGIVDGCLYFVMFVTGGPLAIYYLMILLDGLLALPAPVQIVAIISLAIIILVIYVNYFQDSGTSEDDVWERQERLRQQEQARFEEQAREERLRKESFQTELERASSLTQRGQPEVAQSILGGMEPRWESERTSHANAGLDASDAIRGQKIKAVAEKKATVQQLRRDFSGPTIGKNRQ